MELPFITRLRKVLPLKDRIHIIKALESRTEKPKSLADLFGCSVTQIKNIMRRKEEYINAWTSNADLHSIRKKQTTLFLAIGTVLCEYTYRCRANNISVTDKHLQEQQVVIARYLNAFEMKPSNYWLRRFKDKFRVDDQPTIMEKKSLNIEDILIDLFGTTSPTSFSPSIFNWYLKENVDEKKLDMAIVDTTLDGFLYSNLNQSTNYSTNTENKDEPELIVIDDDDEDEIGNDTKQNENEGSRLEITDVRSLNSEGQTEASRTSINSYEEAIKYLAPLEEFLLCQEDPRAVGVVGRLEGLLREKMESMKNEGVELKNGR